MRPSTRAGTTISYHCSEVKKTRLALWPAAEDQGEGERFASSRSMLFIKARASRCSWEPRGAAEKAIKASLRKLKSSAVLRVAASNREMSFIVSSFCSRRPRTIQGLSAPHTIIRPRRHLMVRASRHGQRKEALNALDCLKPYADCAQKLFGLTVKLLEEPMPAASYPRTATIFPAENTHPKTSGTSNRGTGCSGM